MLGSQASGGAGGNRATAGTRPGYPDWQAFAVLANTHQELSPVRACLEAGGVPTRWVPRPNQPSGSRKKLMPRLTRVREFRLLLAHVSGMGTSDVSMPEDLRRGRLVEICGGETLWTATADRISRWAFGAELGGQAPRRSDRGRVAIPGAGRPPAHAHRRGRRALRDGPRRQGTGVPPRRGARRRLARKAGGEWSARPASETEEERRLYYVAMTRAGSTLTLTDRLDDPAPFVREIGDPRVQRRKVGVAGPERVPAVRYETLGKGDVNIDFAAGNSVGHRVHSGLSGLRAGDAVELRPTERGGVGIVDGDGMRVGMLSKTAARRWLPRLDAVGTVRVLCLVTRVAEDEQAHEYRQRIAVPSWEYPILEVRST